MSDRRYWVVGRSGLVVLALIAIGVLAIIGYFAYGGFAQQSGERFVVTLHAEQKPGVASAVETMQRRGFTPVRDANELSVRVGANTRTVVFTPASFRGASQDMLRSLYLRGGDGRMLGHSEAGLTL